MLLEIILEEIDRKLTATRIFIEVSSGLGSSLACICLQYAADSFQELEKQLFYFANCNIDNTYGLCESLQRSSHSDSKRYVKQLESLRDELNCSGDDWLWTTFVIVTELSGKSCDRIQCYYGPDSNCVCGDSITRSSMEYIGREWDLY